MKTKFTLLAIIASLFCWGCSNADTSSASEESSKTEAVVDGDSSRVLVYTYDKFLSKKDVSILDADTSKISVDGGFARSIDKELPRKGNVIVVWNDKKRLPFYLRVASVKEESGRIVLDVDKATPFEALPANSDFNLSSELYVDAEKLDENGSGDIDVSAFYDKANNTYHPVVIYQGQNRNDENEDTLEYTELSKNEYEDAFVDGILDMRELLKSNFEWDKKTSFAGIDWQFTPGAVAIPGLGSNYGDYKGSLKNFFKGVSAMDKAFRDNAGRNYQDGLLDVAKGYIRVDTLRIKKQVNFRIYVKTTWYGRLDNFDLRLYVNGGYEISNIGFGLGAGISGEKQLTHWNGFDVIFWVGPVPIAIDFKPNFYFKYKIEAYGMFNYNWGYKYTQSDTVGFSWNRDRGFRNIDQVHEKSTSNKPKNFREFIANSKFIVNGKASAGIYLRMPILFYYAAGPTVGVGLRADLESQVGGTMVLDENGDWDSFDPSGRITLNGAIPLEVGGEIDILSVKVFSRAYDVWDITKWKMLDLNTDDYK